MLRVEGDGPHASLLSTLCAQCPQGSGGCCVGPPEYDWSDIGRVVVKGGRDFLLAQLGRGQLTRVPRGLVLRRVRRREARDLPRQSKCVHHGPTGCTIANDLRPATCNYYLCEDTFTEPSARQDPHAWEACRTAHARLSATYKAWDEVLSARIAQAWPDGPPWDAGFLDWLGTQFEDLSHIR